MTPVIHPQMTTEEKTHAARFLTLQTMARLFDETYEVKELSKDSQVAIVNHEGMSGIVDVAIFFGGINPWKR